ncbi:MAG: RNA polymerase sigma factor [Candidatus Zixiibacteriota bacterium]
MIKDIVALTYRMTQDREAAFDLAQEAFISAWENLRRFRGKSMFQGWLYRIASNKTLNFLKKQSRRQTISIDSPSVGVVASQTPSDNPEQLLQKVELQKNVLDFMAGLPVQQRLVFDLRFYKGLAFEEITHITGKALGTVKSHYREAVNKLRTFAKQRGWKS